MNAAKTIGVVGLGYVGLPLATSFATRHDVIGYDIDHLRVEELRNGVDRTNETGGSDIRNPRLTFTSDPADLERADFVIVAVPTPVDESLSPDLRALRSAATIVGRHLRRDAVVVFESTVYPGVTEEICVPILENESSMKCGVEFFVGYSPERINPGDREHTFTKITKVVSGQTDEVTERIAEVYGSVVGAGIFKASSIRVAEAAKVIENTQRDLNIALMNELAVIFHRLGIDTGDVLAAAKTKWNFLPFSPGLVGGHCIGVDPYYLTYRAEQVGYHPDVILAGRRINDGMGEYVADQLILELVRRGQLVKGCRVTILGLTFKENVPDLRNSGVVRVIRKLAEYGVRVQAHDPIVSETMVRKEIGIENIAREQIEPGAGVVLAVAHATFVEEGWELPMSLLEDAGGVVMDVKRVLPIPAPDGVIHWRL